MVVCWWFDNFEVENGNLLEVLVVVVRWRSFNWCHGVLGLGGVGGGIKSACDQ